MKRILVPAGALLLAALAWWLLVPDSAAPLPGAASVRTAPARPAPLDLPDRAETEPLPLTGKGAARIRLEDGAGHSAWWPTDTLNIWRVKAPSRSYVAKLSTDAAGALSLEDLEPGPYVVELTHTTLGPLSAEFEVRPGQVADCVLPCGSPNLDRRLTLRLVMGAGRDFPPDASCLSALVSSEGQEPRAARLLTSHLLVLDDCELVAHDVVLRWLDEPPVTLHGLRPRRQPHDVKLEGAATLEVMCRAAGEGAPLAAAAVSVLCGTGDDASRIAGSTDASGRVVFARLPAGRVSLSADHKDFVRIEQPDVQLKSGSTLRRELVLEPGCTIIGDVRYASGETAKATVVVLGREQPPMAPNPPADWERELLTRSEGGGWFAWRMAPTLSPPGRFSAPGLPAGSWKLIAGTQGPVLGEPLIVEVTREQPLLVSLQLPPAHWLRGQLLVPGGQSISDLCIVCEAEQRTGPVRVGVSADGSFLVGPLAPGTYSVRAGPCSPDRGRVGLGSFDTLGTFEMPADSDVVKTFDLGDKAPASLDVALHVEGLWPEELSITAVAPDSAATLFSAKVEPQATSRSGGDARATLSPILARRVQLIVIGDRWIEPLPQIIELPAWGRSEAQASVTVVTGTLVVRGRHGLLPAGTNVRIGRLEERPWHSPATYVLDADGRVQITAPPGTLVFSLDRGWGWPDAGSPQVQWLPGGPQPATVEVLTKAEAEGRAR